MAFYNPYQTQQYPQYAQQFAPYQMQMQRAQQYNRPGEIIKVNGAQGAQAYQMGPNEATALFDANEDYFYIKTTDGAGFATIRKFKFSPCAEEREEPKQEYVTRKEFDELKEAVLNGKQHFWTEPESATDGSDEDTERTAPICSRNDAPKGKTRGRAFNRQWANDTGSV